MQTLGPVVHSASALQGLQVFVVVSQMGDGFLQSVFATHSTQVFLVVLQASLPAVVQWAVSVHSTHLPVAQPGVALSRARHSSFFVQALQVLVAVWQMGFVAPLQSVLTSHSTHLPDITHTGAAGLSTMHSAAAEHLRHMLAAMSQIGVSLPHFSTSHENASCASLASPASFVSGAGASASASPVPPSVYAQVP
jgi:hypothetical protein